MDDKIRVHYDDSTASDVRLKQFPDEQLANAWVHGTKKSTGYILKDAVDGPISERKIEVDPVEISWKIKELAKYLGAGAAGIAKLNQKWVYSHHGYPGREEWGEPINLPHQYAIVMGFPHTWDIWLSNAKIGIPGFMDDWHFYNLMASAAVRMGAAIRDMGYPARADIQSNYNCLLPPLAVDAGLGEQCRIGVCISKEYGPAFRLVAVTTDLPLIPDPPANLGIEDFCSHCTKCADVCPSGAISRGDKIDMNGHTVWKQDVYKCFRYWNANGVSCSICRRACPWSKPGTFPHRMVSNLAQHVPTIRPFLIWADDVVYGKRPRYHPPPKWLQGKHQRRNLISKFNYWFDHM
jgi:ferredoxin